MQSSMVVWLVIFLLTLPGTAPLTGIHAGRLAVEQLYGYMTRNAKTYGILTTLSGWCFAFRNDGARLFMTRMFGFGPEAAAEYRQSEITIMMGLYYLSRIAQETADTPETTQGQGRSVLLPFADADRTTAAPTVQRILPPAQPPQPPPPTSPGQENWHGQDMYRLCRFEPWVKEN